MNPRNTIIALLLCCCPICASAQTGGDNYRDIYNEAEQKYNIGQLEQAEELLQHHIKTLPIEMRQSAYRLLALCYLGMDRDTEAQDYVRLLLDNNPYYSTTLDDPQRFIDMVENIKAGNTATITTASSQAETLQEVPVPTTLITEEMIRVSGARNLQEVLAIYVPGMIPIDCNDDINISMRGIYSNSQEKILFMLNGHRLNSYCTNTAAPDFSISLEKLKQIEVLRGPASSLYGQAGSRGGRPQGAGRNRQLRPVSRRCHLRKAILRPGPTGMGQLPHGQGRAAIRWQRRHRTEAV